MTGCARGSSTSCAGASATSLVASELKPNDDLWVRIATDAWKEAGEALYQMGFEYFCYLSAIDWMPSPYGRGEDDPTEPPPERETAIRQGVTGGDTRFQVLARVTDIRRHVGVTLKADVPDDALAIESWFTVYAGANWHERETHEMFGISFTGHPDLRNMYLPTEFEGYPLRKDFPLLARMVKPWPGIVDVEPMPAEEAPPDDAVAGEIAPENPTPDQADAGIGDRAGGGRRSGRRRGPQRRGGARPRAAARRRGAHRLWCAAGPDRRHPGRCRLHRGRRSDAAGAAAETRRAAGRRVRRRRRRRSEPTTVARRARRRGRRPTTTTSTTSRAPARRRRCRRPRTRRAERPSGRRRVGRSETGDRPPVRAPAALLHRRPGRRRPPQRRAGDRGHDPQHRPPAPGDARHAAHHRAPRRRAGRVGRAVVRLHAPRLREAHRGPHVPAGHDARQPHRLARQLRQRGARSSSPPRS